jgi:hypothetical protein
MHGLSHGPHHQSLPLYTKCYKKSFLTEGFPALSWKLKLYFFGSSESRKTHFSFVAKVGKWFFYLSSID